MSNMNPRRVNSFAPALLAIAGLLGIVCALPLAAQDFDPQAATRAYLDSVPADVRERSDAYFEGGYWILLWSTLYAVGVAFVLLRFRISSRLRAWAEKLTRFRFVHTLAYGAQYVIAAFALGLPWAVYTGFYREHQYGLATQSFGPWLVEQLIGLGVSVVLFGLLIAFVYALIRKAPRTWPLWGGGLAAGFLMLVLTIAPVFIAPLFNEYKPLEEGELRTEILAMARANGVPAREVYWFDASRQTTRISANVSGLFGTARVALNDNLLNEGTPPEIKAVMGHEIGHFVSSLIIVLIIPFSLLVTLGFVLVKLLFPKLHANYGANWGVRDTADPAGFPLIVALITVFFFLMTPVTNTITRENERMADVFGLNAAREPDGFATVSLKLASYRKLEPSRFEEIVFYDHPSGASRVAMAMRWKAENLSE